ncbi:MAG: Ig-like domain-containing protein [candidate division Zixibacteria bacterium]|nr:Ig-like domain-containing protein [candidate division Zixibacteria bacterium]MDH3935760.1 Ig-like domain-containing protein [candidate division Zixibacteria bacterium]
MFIDEFGNSVTFEAFLGSKLDAVQIDQTGYQSSRSLIVTVPDSGDASGSYAGGAFTANVARDLTDYNALTFWAKASTAATLDVAGIGNDNTGTSKYTAEVTNLAITTGWQKYTIPIPLSEKLDAEQGLFYFAEGPEGGVGNTIWFDEVQFAQLSTITNPRPALTSRTIDVESGETVDVGNAIVTFDVDGTDINVSAMPGYFTFTSSNTGVVSVDADGVISGAGVGDATLTATLGTVAATGSITVNVNTPQAVPSTAAPTPTVDAADVISLFSNAYTDETVNLWSTDWDDTDLEDITIGSDDIKKYYNLSFAGVDFSDPTIDVSSMTRFHMDVWTPVPTDAPAEFTIKLVDFGADGAFGGGDDREHELAFDENTMSSESWVSIDVPLLAFSGLTTKGHLAQMIISGDLGTVYIDNIYFYDAGPQTAPTVPAPTPTVGAANVISLFSDAYTDVPVDTWSAVYDVADVEEYAIGSDNTKKYSNLLFAGIEFLTTTVDASALTHFHIDVWTADATASPALFKIKLVDLGANGVYGGGDDVEHEVTLDHNTMNTGIWVSIDIPLSSFSGLTTRGQLGQLIISGNPNTVFVDNIYFYDSGIPTIPLVPAPTPTLDAADVVSLFSDAYTDVPVDTWSAAWDSATVEDFMIGSDATKKYSYLLFAGIEFKTTTIDASAMTHLYMNVWTPDATASPSVLKIKLVDFGANGVWDGGDDVEHEITLDESSMNTSSWVTLDIPLSDFVDLTTKGHLAQLIISGDPNTLYVDNIYLHK